jgi:hypothetical protein
MQAMEERVESRPTRGDRLTASVAGERAVNDIEGSK